MSFPRHGEIYREARRGLRDEGRRSCCADAPTHALDEFPAGYSSAGCAPAEPASASPAGNQLTMTGTPQPSFFQRTGTTSLANCLTSGVHSDELLHVDVKGVKIHSASLFLQLQFECC